MTENKSTDKKLVENFFRSKMLKAKPSYTKPTDAWFRRQRIWKHNSFFGHCGMIKMQMLAVRDAETTSPLAKTLARQISDMADALAVALKERNDGQS